MIGPLLRRATLAASLLLAGCATTTSTSTTGGSVAAPPSAPMAWDVRVEGRQWTAVTQAAIDRLAPQILDILPADIDAFCPGYRTAGPAGRRLFYTALLSELARYESNFEPSTRMQESFSDSRGQRVISRGLLQLSQESANGYGCAITVPDQLYDPTTNIECAVRILGRWVERDQLIAGFSGGAWRGASRYWSPLRDRNKLVDLQAALIAKPYCARPRR
jgi:hypothetical protein